MGGHTGKHGISCTQNLLRVSQAQSGSISARHQRETGSHTAPRAIRCHQAHGCPGVAEILTGQPSTWLRHDYHLSVPVDRNHDSCPNGKKKTVVPVSSCVMSSRVGMKLWVRGIALLTTLMSTFNRISFAVRLGVTTAGDI